MYGNNYYGMGYQPPNYYPPADMLGQLRAQQQPMQQPQMQVQPQQPTQNAGLIWVQGEAGAKSYLVAPSNTVMLMDSEAERFYIKTSDASGVPMPLRVFEYKELTANAPQSAVVASRSDFQFDPDKYVTRDELNEILAKMGKTEPAPKRGKNVKEDDADA